MPEFIKVYLSDWFYNAGIVGFLKILLGEQRLDKQDLVKIGENYIVFPRSMFKGYADRYFQTAFEQYGRFENVKQVLKSFVNDLKKLQIEESCIKIAPKYLRKPDIEKLKDEPQKLALKIAQEIYTRYKRILDSFKYLKGKTGKVPSKNEFKKDIGVFILHLKDVLKVMDEECEAFLESEVKVYLSKLYGQKSFLQRQLKKDFKKVFIKDFEKPILNAKVPVDEKHICISCGLRPAKKNVLFDTGLSPFLGVNKDALNVFWQFNPKLPLCEICELIYFSAFAGLTDFTRGNNNVFYFVNRDSSVEELYNANLLLQQVLKKNTNENFLIDFFTELILLEEQQKAEYSLQNIALIEIDLSKDILPKVFSFNISREKAKFIKNHTQDLKSLARLGYEIKDERRYVLFELIGDILRNSLTYDYVNKLLRFYMSALRPAKRSSFKVYYYPYHLQTITKIINTFIEYVILRRTPMHEEKDLWSAYHRGKELADRLRTKKAENKIDGIAYRLVNALRIGDVNTFMNVLIRTYMANEMEVPAMFIKSFVDKNTFYAYGYSFINGLLSKDKQQEENNE